MVQTPMSLIEGMVEWIMDTTGWFMGTSGSTEASIKPCQDQTKVVSKVNSASSLNPNAKVFTPPLNPNAKEFTPAKRPQEPVDFTTVAPDFDIHSVTAFPELVVRAASLPPDTTYDSPTTSQCSEPSCDGIDSDKVSSQNITPTGSATVTPSGSACVTPAPDMETALKATTARLCTPWVQQDGKAGLLQCSESEDETVESEDETVESDEAESDTDCDELFSDDSDVDGEEEDNDVTNTPTCDER